MSTLFKMSPRSFLRPSSVLLPAAAALAIALAVPAGAAQAQPVSAAPPPAQATAPPGEAQSNATLAGTVVDGEGNPIAAALVRLFGPNRQQVGQADTDAQGRFRFDGLVAGRNYELRVTVPPFRDRVELVQIRAGDNSIAIDLAAQIEESVTVTGNRGIVQDETRIAGTVRSLNLDVLEERAPDLLPRMLSEETGVIAQQTTPGQGSPILRGQSAQAVLYLIDGIRYNNATYRDGNTQYLAWIPGAAVDGLDIQLGPSGVNYGSDALGGAINVSTEQLPAFARDESWQWHGAGRAFFESSSNGAGGEASIGGATERFAGLVTGTGSAHQDLRTGGGEDSHNVLRRYFGFSTDRVEELLGSRLVDTDYRSVGVTGKGSRRVGDAGSLTGFFLRNEQFDVRRYDRLLGGDGRFRAAFTPQILEFGYGRYQDVVAEDVFVEATFSINRQTDGREDQRFRDSTLTVEENAVTAYGYEFMASTGFGDHLISTGVEVYDEYVGAFRNDVDGGVVTPVRPRVPNGSRYTSMGAFLLDDWALLDERMQLTSGVRFSHFRAAMRAEENVIDGTPAVPDFNESFSDVTFNVGSTYQLTDAASVYGRVARGFRAPSLFDFGETGLTGGGFEVAPREAVALNALIGESAGSGALSTGLAWGDLSPELLWSFEAGFRWRDDDTRIDFAAFDSELTDTISRRVIIAPGNVIGQIVGGETIVAQDEVGRIFVAVDNDPVVSRANIGRSRVWGIEWLFERTINRSMLFIFKGGAQRGRELDTDQWARKIAPDHFDVILRWNESGGRLFLEGVFIGMLAQDRLNPGDLDDRRIGAFRDADGIEDWFNNGAVDLGLVDNGILTVTGETLTEVQQRVLGPGLEGNALFTETPGWWTLALRGGYTLNANNELTFAVNNIFDRNYRLHGSGFDAAGFSAVVAWNGSF